MRSLEDIRQLLAELDHQQAEDLEDQDLDFKEWSRSSLHDAVALVVDEYRIAQSAMVCAILTIIALKIAHPSLYELFSPNKAQRMAQDNWPGSAL